MWKSSGGFMKLFPSLVNPFPIPTPIPIPPPDPNQTLDMWDYDILAPFISGFGSAWVLAQQNYLIAIAFVLGVICSLVGWLAYTVVQAQQPDPPPDTSQPIEITQLNTVQGFEQVNSFADDPLPPWLT